MISLKQLLEVGYKDILQNQDENESFLRDVLKKHPDVEIYSGRYGSVLLHPKWKYAVKTFTNDVPYLKFVRFVLQHPRKSFPKFYDKPRKIVPNYKRHKNSPYLYVVLTEKLEPITKEEFKDIDFYSYNYGLYDDLIEKYNKDPDSYNTDYTNYQQAYDKCKELDKKYPSLRQFMEDKWYLYYHIPENIGAEDFHARNIMKRKNGELVYIDPFWEGTNPYRDHDEMMRRETDYYGDMIDTEADYVKGGTLPKRKKKKPVKSTYKMDTPDNEVPF